MSFSDDYSITTVRNVRVPAPQIWRAWQTPSVIAQWWGPDGFVNTVKTLDVRPGGRFEIVMHGPDGTDYANVYIFDEVVDHERLVYTNQGSEVFGLAPFRSHFQIASRADALDPSDAGSTVTLSAHFATESDFARHRDEFGAVEGGRQLLARLEAAALLA